MRVPRTLVLAAYIVAVSFILLPLLQSVLGAWPLRPAEASWRFGAAGLASNAVLSELMGLLLLAGLSLGLAHRVALRVIAVLSVLATVALVLGLGLLTLDALELRSGVRDEARLGFDLAALQLLAKLVLSSICTSLIAWGGWSASRKPREARARDRGSRGPGILIGFRQRRTEVGGV